MTFAYPVLLVVPLLLLAIYRLRRPVRAALPCSSVSPFQTAGRNWRVRLRKPVLGLLAALFAVAAAVAAARPQRVTALESPQQARNVMLALDISKSMASEDFRAGGDFVSRVKAVKAVVGEFIRARPQDALGLVVFGSSAYLQAPLTLDHGILQELVSRLEAGMAGDQTAMGDGLGVSVKHLQRLPGQTRAIILLTDGVSNAGQVNPIKAAKVARDIGIKVHTIGIGADPRDVPRMGGFFGRILQPAEFDEKTLKEIADITGGVYFSASSLEGLKTVYAEIDKLETAEQRGAHNRLVEEFFFYPAAAALAAYLLYVLLSRTIFLKVP